MKLPRLSFWEREALQAPVDIAVIGGGIVGLSAAIEAKERYPRRSVRVYERHTLSTGAGSRNAGFGCFGSLGELRSDLESRSETEVLDLIGQRWAGLRYLRERLGDARLRYEACGGYELFLPAEAASYQACLELLSWFNDRLTATVGSAVYRPVDAAIRPMGLRGVAHLIHNAYEGLLHPGYLLAGLRQRALTLGIETQYGLSVEHLEATSSAVRLHTAAGEIRCEQALVATNAFTPALLPDLEVHPARNQVLLTAPLPRLRLRGGFHYRDGYVYFRHVGDRLLIGGGRFLDPEGETTTDFGDTEIIQQYLKKFLHKHLVEGPIAIQHRWSGILGVGEHKAPIVRTVAPGLHVGVRLGGMGVALGSLTARRLAGLLT